MTNINIDITDAASRTNSPFAQPCKLLVNGNTVPANAILAVRISAVSYRPPVRLHSITSTESGVLLEFRSCDGAVIAECDMPRVPGLSTDYADYVTYPIKTSTGVLAGHLVCRPDLAALLKGWVPERFVTAYDDFVLSADCCYSRLAGNCRTLGVAGDWRFDDVQLAPSDVVRITGGSGSPVAVDALCINVPEQMRYGICWLQIGTGARTWIGDCNLWMHSYKASNLRVVLENNRLVFTGVKDV